MVMYKTAHGLEYGGMKETVMKRALVFLAVLGLAGNAEGTISLVPEQAMVPFGETVTISVVSDSSDSYGCWLELSSNGIGAFGEVQILPAAGSDATKDFTWDPWWCLEAKSFNPASPIVPGTHFTIDFTMYTEGCASLTLYEFDGVTPLQTVEICPEPATLALLGIGGMLLRRRGR